MLDSSQGDDRVSFMDRLVRELSAPPSGEMGNDFPPPDPVTPEGSTMESMVSPMAEVPPEMGMMAPGMGMGEGMGGGMHPMPDGSMMPDAEMEGAGLPPMDMSQMQSTLGGLSQIPGMPPLPPGLGGGVGADAGSAGGAPPPPPPPPAPPTPPPRPESDPLAAQARRMAAERLAGAPQFRGR